jgi:hypothetical protein
MSKDKIEELFSLKSANYYIYDKENNIIKLIDNNYLNKGLVLKELIGIQSYLDSNQIKYNIQNNNIIIER